LLFLQFLSSYPFHGTQNIAEQNLNSVPPLFSPTTLSGDQAYNIANLQNICKQTVLVSIGKRKKSN